MTVLRGIVQFYAHPRQRLRLRQIADQIQGSRVSTIAGKPVLAFVINIEDRELLVEALRCMAEAVVDE